MKSRADYIAEALKSNEAINAPHVPTINKYETAMQAKQTEIDDLYVKLQVLTDRPEYEALTNDIYKLIDDTEKLSFNLSKLIDEMRKQA